MNFNPERFQNQGYGDAEGTESPVIIQAENVLKICNQHTVSGSPLSLSKLVFVPKVTPCF